MKILIAPNAFKHSVTAAQAAEAIHAGFVQSGLKAEYVLCPLADGGDGSLQLLKHYLSAEIITVNVDDPIGRTIRAQYAYNSETNEAAVEMAEASGIRLLKSHELEPWKASTKGTGQLILDAIKKGARKIYLAVGGSATVDGGVGILKALGTRFLNKQGVEIFPGGPEDLIKINSIETAESLKLLDGVCLTVVCDVENPLLGVEGAATVYGPQKGFKSEEIPLLEKAMTHWSKVIQATSGVDVGTLPKGGASGGIPAAMYACCNAELVSGSSHFIEMGNIEKHLQGASMIVTGEGQIDMQSLYGKLPGELMQLAKKYDVPIVVMCGAVKERDKLIDAGFDDIIAISKGIDSLDEALMKTSENLSRYACELGEHLSVGKPGQHHS
ncbi:glycerate kinase [Puteibacter caeruleilacunae]|nr:glycerate kinase [Puteibacter caeruleilacunae]